MDAHSSITDTPQDNTLETARQKLTPEEREALAADFKRQQSEKRSKQRKAIAAKLRAEGRPYSGKPKLGFKRVVDKHGHKRDISDSRQRALMQEIVRLKDEDGMSFRAISDEVAKKCLIAAGQQVVPGSLSQWNELWCRHAYKTERELQAKGL